MVCVQIRQPHPIPLAHLPKVRMRRPAKIPGLPHEVLQQVLQFAHVRRKLHWWSASAGLLVQLWHSFESVWPLHRRPQRGPPQHFARIHSARRRNFLLSHVQPKSVAQMPNHLVRRHFPPQTRAVWPQGINPPRDFLFVFRIPQILHGQKFYTWSRWAISSVAALRSPIAGTAPVSFCDPL
jgi:hypothetical protein